MNRLTWVLFLAFCCPILFWIIFYLRLWISIDNIIKATLYKLVFYINFMGLMNGWFYLYNIMSENNVDTFIFQKDLIQYNLYIYLVLILMETPLWIDVLF